MSSTPLRNYPDTVSSLREKELDKRADQFAALYRPDRPSVVLVPGGMGSRLLQADTAFQDGQVYPQIPTYREIWLSVAAIVHRDIGQIEMTTTGRDFTARPMIAAGELSSFIKKYDRTEEFFRTRANYIGFGYDWRKSPQDEAGYLHYFLMKLKNKVMQHGHADPLPRLTLLGHSQGGLVTKLFISNVVDRGEDSDLWFARFVSVATPFYGTFTHMQRYFVGENLANLVVGGGGREVARIAASLSGPYGLLFAPRDVLAPRYGQLGLARYPLRDFGDDSLELDPFDPAQRPRFPAFMVGGYLAKARSMLVEVDREVPQSVSRKIFHIRSNIRTTATTLEQRWQPGAGDVFHAQESSPLRDNAGASDGTVPFWSARLAWVDNARVYNLVNTGNGGLEHSGLMEHPTVLDIIWQLITDAPPPGGAVPAAPIMQRANVDQATRVLTEALVQQSTDKLEGLPREVQRALEDGLMLG
jgi:hypothetical protein